MIYNYQHKVSLYVNTEMFHETWVNIRKKYLQSQGVLDRKYCAQKHSDGTVTLPVVASVLAQLDLVELMKHVAQNSFCEIVDIQLPLSDLADRVNLGLIPSSEEGWPVACRLLKRDTGGILHIHQNVTTPLHHEPPEHSSALDVEKGSSIKECSLRIQRDMQVWTAWASDTARHICTLLLDITGSKWKTNIKHIEHVKTYIPHISHVVLDLECKPF